MNLEKFTRFMELTHALRRQKRNIPLGEGGQENDVEHSYQLAMTAWLLIEAYELPLDLAKTFKYCLAHDLPEAYAGDVDCLASPTERAQKEIREKQARKKLKEEFPEFQDLHETIEAYEQPSAGNAEAAFVYALDKLLPMNNIRISGQPQWREQRVSIEKIMANKRPKILSVPALHDLWQELEAVLRAQPQLFFQEQQPPK